MKYLGQILVESFGLKEEALTAALKLQKEKGGRLGRLLVQQKKISEEDLLRALSIQFDLDLRMSLPPNPDPFFINKVPIGFLRKFKMMPVATPKEAFVALSDPFHFQQIDDLQRLLGLEGCKTFLVPTDEILLA
ncbi:type II secretion system protein GspE, partial [Desulfobulbus sp. F3]|nr:type II secretion system protein GspE [Desulfobulbus sp. F3]